MELVINALTPNFPCGSRVHDSAFFCVLCMNLFVWLRQLYVLWKVRTVDWKIFCPDGTVTAILRSLSAEHGSGDRDRQWKDEGSWYI